MKKKSFKKEIQSKLADKTFRIIDIIDLFNAQQPIPSYFKSVPLLITSDPITDNVIDMQTDGNAIYKWILSNTTRGSYATGTSYGGKINYSCRSGGLSFNPSGKGGEGGDPSQFLEPIEPRGNKKINNELDNYNKEYKKMSSDLGLHQQERFCSQDGEDDQPPKQAAVGGKSGGGAGFASINRKKKSSSRRGKKTIGAYNG